MYACARIPFFQFELLSKFDLQCFKKSRIVFISRRSVTVIVVAPLINENELKL